MPVTDVGDLEAKLAWTSSRRNLAHVGVHWD